MQETNASQGARLDDAAALLQDKDRLEETVKKQHALIEQRGQELKVLKAQLDGKEAALEKARYHGAVCIVAGHCWPLNSKLGLPCSACLQGSLGSHCVPGSATCTHSVLCQSLPVGLGLIEDKSGRSKPNCASRSRHAVVLQG